MKKYIFITISLYLLVAACSKDDAVTPPVKGPDYYLAGDTGKVWIDFYRGGTQIDNSHYVVTTPCYIDDNWVFKPGGYFEWNEGGSKCDVADPYVYSSGNWKLSSDNRYIEFNNVTGSPEVKSSFKFEIVELTINKLSIKIAAADLFISTNHIGEDHTLIAK